MRALVLCAGLLAAGCGGSSGYHPHIDPAHFVSGVDNPYFPLVPGTVLEYDVLETDEVVTVTVTSETRVVMGVTCMVVHDVSTVSSVVAEDTYDWYAQDDAGNLWYFGEDTTAYDGDQSSKEGSWEAGVDGAEPGIAIEGDPRVGDVYREEFLAGEAEDQGEVLDLDAAITVPYGSFTGCMLTREFTELEPDNVEQKYWCPGVGNVESHTVSGGAEHEQLVQVTAP